MAYIDEKNNKERLGDYLRELRGSRSQDEIAELAQMTGSGLSLLENGTREPKISTLVNLSQALKVSEAKLIAVYKGQNPDAIADDQKYKAPLIEFLSHLPDDLILEALKARPPQEVLKGLIESKGMEKIQECLTEAKRRHQEKQ